jgi:predicted DsbA family dithiol-disulfide isomerase
MTTVEVVEYTDPWCSWAWGTEPKLRLLRWRHAGRLQWRRVVGDLLPARPIEDPGPRPAERAAYWQVVNGHTGMPWPDGLRWNPSASALASRAVLAAGLQGEEHAGRLLRAVRESCFVFCEPADTPARIVALAETALPGLDPDRLAADLDSSAVREAFATGRAETRRPNQYVLDLDETHEGKGNAKPDGEGGWRYVFPTLLFRGPGGEHTVPGWQPWERYEAAMEEAAPESTTGARPDPTPDEALAEWPLLTAMELEFICGPGSAPPADAVPLSAGGGPVWIDKQDGRADTAR